MVKSICDSTDILFLATDPNYRGTAADNWDDRVKRSIVRERLETEKRYGIKIGRTEIHCSVCGRVWDLTGNHGCKGFSAHDDMVRKD